MKVRDKVAFKPKIKSDKDFPQKENVIYLRVICMYNIYMKRAKERIHRCEIILKETMEVPQHRDGGCPSDYYKLNFNSSLYESNSNTKGNREIAISSGAGAEAEAEAEGIDLNLKL